jgi:hypothetical protein
MLTNVCLLTAWVMCRSGTLAIFHGSQSVVEKAEQEIVRYFNKKFLSTVMINFGYFSKHKDHQHA